MSERQKSSRAALISIGLLVLLIAIVSIFVSRKSDSSPQNSDPLAETTEGQNKSPAGGSTDEKDRVAKTLEDALSLSGSKENTRSPFTPPRTSATKPDRSGRIPKVAGSVDGEFEPRDIALGYLESDAPGSPVESGWSDQDLESPKILSEAISRKSGVTSLHLRQTVGGIEVYNADMNINVAKDGSILSAHNGFVRNIVTQIQSTEPVLSVEEAIAKAAQHVAVAHPKESLQILKNPDGPAQESVFDGGGVSQDPIPAKLVYVATADGEAKLAWNMVLHLYDGVRWLDLNIDAENGELLSQANWYANADYNVFAQPKEHPTDGPRTVETNPHDLSASPFGWHDTNGSAGAERTDTRGNNVEAQEDTDANNSGGRRPSGGGGLVFNNPLNLSQTPPNYEDAAITNLFYWNSLIHDVLWHHGFDEASGNFQVNNYGRGGTGGDPVQADAQDGSGTNNANFGTPPEGQDPRMQMFVWTETTPSRDSDLENGIIIHEYGHGVSNRLTGGPTNSSALIQSQSRGMGEGWSDWFALVLTAVPSDAATTPRGIGTYVLGEPVTGPGIRPYRYSTSLVENPQTYGNIQSGLSVPHGIGSVWCTTIWEVYWALVGVHGFDSNLYTGTGGNNIALDLIVEGLKLQPANPTYLDARDAIIQADQEIYGGANNSIIWQAFAKRGMGFSAFDGGSASSLNVTEAFDLPDEALSISDVTVVEGDSGSINAIFSVDLDMASDDEVRVDWSTANDTATAGDFTAGSGQLIFPVGQTSRTVTVSVSGDATPEEDETFFVRLSNSTGAHIFDDEGIGTIRNDDYITPVITSSLSAIAIEQFPFSYTIEADNTPRTFSISNAPAGMTVDSVTGVVSWIPPGQGNFSFDITAANPAASDTETVSLEILENSLNTALDVDGIRIFNSPVPFALQIDDTHDGVDAARSGPVTHDETSIMQIEVEGPERISFWWKVSSEANYDYLRFTVDGQVIEQIHGEEDWQQVIHDLPDNKRYIVRWEYDKDFSVDIGADAGWVDQLVLLAFDLRPFLTSPNSAYGAKGDSFSYQIETSKPATSYSSTSLPAGLTLNPMTGLISGTPVAGGNTPVTVTLSNADGTTQETLNILILELVTLPFSDNFESGQFEPHWLVTGTNTYRTEVSQANGPRGNWHVLMDSSLDQSYARNEMTFYSDIRGMRDVELKFWAREFSDEDDGPPSSPFVDGADFDGIAISPDQVNWYEIQPLRSDEISGTYSQFTVDINAEMSALGLEYGEFFGIRFNHYDNYELTTDGFAFDDITLTGAASSVSAPTLSSSSDWGTSNSDGFTGDDTPTFTGTGSPGAEVTLRSDVDGVIKRGLVSGGGTWSIATDPISDGTHSITASIHGGAESAPVSVTIESVRPTVTVTQASGQADPATGGPVEFDIVFSEPIFDFVEGDLDVGGNAGGAVTLTGGPTNFHVSIATTTSEGAVSLTVPASSAEDAAGNQNSISTSADNYVEIDTHESQGGSPSAVALSSGTGMEAGWMEETDTDTFEFTITGPRLTHIYTSGSVNTRGELRNADGDLINDPNADDQFGAGDNFRITETIPPGTYTVIVTANTSRGSPQGSYDLHIDASDVPLLQPDVITSGLGDDVYTTLTGQSASLRSRKGRTVSASSTVNNDGEVTDDFVVSASPGNSIFRVSYISEVDGNVTAALKAGTLQIGAMAPSDDPYKIRTVVSPVKKKIRKKLPKRRRKGGRKWKYKTRTYSTIIRAVSDLDGTQSDQGRIQVKTTK